jgi:ABC-type nitrate/sulfonate/bicarbonate transport system substrate-binding protein
MSNRRTVRLAAGSGETFGVDDLACAAATYLGLWDEEGLDVAWTPVHGGVAAIQAVLDGRVDVSYGGLGPVLKFRSEGHPVRIFVSMARGLAQNLVTQSRINDSSQLRGASWALDGFGALSHHMARLLVRALGIDENEIKWEAVGPPPQRIERLLADTVDVSLIRVEEAVALDLDRKNNLHNLLGFSELKTLVPVQPHGVLATQDSYVRTNGEVLHRLTRGMIRASRALHDNFDVFRKVYDHHISVSVPPDRVQKIWKQERDSAGFAINGELSRAHWEKQISLFYELNPQLPQILMNEVIADNFVRDALGALGVVPGADVPT